MSDCKNAVSPHYWRPDTPAVREAEAALEAASDARRRAVAEDVPYPEFVQHMHAVSKAVERLRLARLDAIERMFV